MSWHYSQALAAASLEENSLGGEPCVPSKSMPMPAMCCSQDKMMDHSNHSQSGTTCERSPVVRGVDWWISSLAVSRVRTSASVARHELDCQASEVGFGVRWPESFARWDQASFSWKTPQLSLLEGLDVFWGSFPKWGMMRTGECWALAASVQHNEESESGYWPPPLASDFRNRGSRCGKGQWNLSHVLHKYGRLDLQLSPTFREWLMGWPIGWTDLQPLETVRFRQWCDSHGTHCTEIQNIRPDRQQSGPGSG